MKSRNPLLGKTRAKAGGRGALVAPAVVLALVMLAIGTPLANPNGSAKAKPAAAPAPRPSAKPAAAQAPLPPADPAAPPKLDSARVHKLYLEGDFDEAIGILENNLKDPHQYRHEDSVFIFKHLGVMYAAQYETREKGKYFMHRLLMVEPTAKIMDMYASDMIYMIFKNIQEEFDQNRMQLTLRSSGADPKPDTARPPKQEPKGTSSGGKGWIWAGAAAVTVAAGVGTYILLTDEPKTTVRDHKVGQ